MPAIANATPAASKRSRAGSASVSAPASPVPAIAPSTLPAPINAYTRLAWVTVKRALTLSQKRATNKVAAVADQT